MPPKLALCSASSAFIASRGEAATLAVESTPLQRRVEQRVVTLDVGGQEVEAILDVARARPALALDVTREQESLERVEAAVGPRLEVAAQIVAKQVVVHESLGSLVGEIGDHDLGEERGILATEEQVQLVTGVLAVALALLLGAERGPARQKLELAQRTFTAVACGDRADQRVGLGQAVDDLELGRADVFEHEFVADAEARVTLAFDEVARGIEAVAQAQIFGLELRLGQGQQPRHQPACVGGHDLHELHAHELFALEGHDTLGVGLEVERHEAGAGEKVEVVRGRQRRRASLGLGRWIG